MTGTCRCCEHLSVKLLLDVLACHALPGEASTLLHAGGAPFNHLRMPGRLAPLVIPARKPEQEGLPAKQEPPPPTAYPHDAGWASHLAGKVRVGRAEGIARPPAPALCPGQHQEGLPVSNSSIQTARLPPSPVCMSSWSLLRPCSHRQAVSWLSPPAIAQVRLGAEASDRPLRDSAPTHMYLAPCHHRNLLWCRIPQCLVLLLRNLPP